MRRSAIVAVLASLSLVGCASPTVMDAAPTPTPAATEAAAPDPTTDAELEAFRGALDGHAPSDAEALVDALEAAGFARSTIERTRELDSLGAPVTFMEIAVRVDGGCLVGQVGDGPPEAIRAAALGGGRCLVGDVIALD